MTDILIRPARFPEDAETVRKLFRDYTDWLNVPLDFQDLETELATLPGKYAAPEGVVLLALSTDGSALGCVALRPLDGVTCEMKRMYLRDEARGLGLGRALADAILQSAREAGYRRMVLDTLARLTEAVRLYERFGFQQVPAYYENPLPGVIYLGRDLY
ncbi:GNAT family N-acetyltransferase [Paracoccus caeni]|uniref:GNAT family N-acetyltransferase n=1 Tax=Paracoccus caeni TaxID=657651 RepID=A0A934VWB1_9RHOB|nr:GNAT family N-acetyltransferase [Paracoccus caeni]MBK4217861.1 GNAT family N-acetyltransferase [Paracoccus caeni]